MKQLTVEKFKSLVAFGKTLLIANSYMEITSTFQEFLKHGVDAPI